MTKCIYKISKYGLYGSNIAEFGDEMLQNAAACYGVIIDDRDRWWSIDEDYILDTLEQSAEFRQALVESGVDQAISENDILDLSYQFYNIDFEDMIEDCCYFIWDYRKKLESLFKEYSINFSKYSDSENIHDKSNIIYKFEVDSNNKTAILNEIELLQESLKADIQNIPAASYKFKGVKIFNIKIKYDSNIIFKIYKI